MNTLGEGTEGKCKEGKKINMWNEIWKYYFHTKEVLSFSHFK